MRGTKAKRLRKAGLRSGPARREPCPRTPGLGGWARSNPLQPNPLIESMAEAKRVRRAERNLRNEWIEYAA